MPLRTWGRGRRIEELLASSSIVISILIMLLLTLPVLYNTGQPKGWDIPRYYYYARYVDENGRLPETDRPLTILSVFVLYKLFFLFGSSVMAFLVFCQMVFLSFYFISVFRFSLSLTGNTDIAFLSTILAPLFTTTLRSQALLSGLFSQALIMLSISYSSDYVVEGDRKDLLKASVLFISSGAANAWYTLYFLLISGVTAVILLLHPSYRSRMVELARRYLFLLPLICLGLSIPFMFRPELLIDIINVLKLSICPGMALEHNWRMIWYMFGGLSLVLGVAGVPFIPRYVRSRVLSVFVLTWVGVSLLLSFTVLATIAFYRPLITVPFYFMGALPLHSYIIGQLPSGGPGHRAPQVGLALRRLKPLPTLVTFLILGCLLLQALAWQRSPFLGPYLDQEDLDDLFWLRDHIGEKAVVCINKVERDQIFWCKAFLESVKREVYLFYGNLTDLLSGHVKVSPGYTDCYFVNKALVEDGVVEELWEFTIILPAFAYDLGVEKALLMKVPGRDIYYLEAGSKERLMAYQEALLTLSEAEIGQLGWEHGLMARLMGEMGLEFDRLGAQVHLPPLEELVKYDLIIMNSLCEIGYEDVEEMLELTSEGTNLVMTGWTANYIYKRDRRAFELLLGATWSDGLSDGYSSVLYNRTHLLTAHMILPHITEGPVSPVGGLTDGLGFGLVNNRTDLYAVVVNERGNSRVASFGKLIEHMDWYERAMLKKLILWALHIDLDLLVPRARPHGLDIGSSEGSSTGSYKPYSWVGRAYLRAPVVKGIPGVNERVGLEVPGDEGPGDGVPVQQRD